MRIRFSFRALLVAFTVVGVSVGLLAMKLNAARRQAKLVGDLRHADANVWYAYEAPSMSQYDPLDERQRLFFPKVSDWKVWLGRRFGRDFAFDVAAVEMNGPMFPADLIARIPELRKLEKLSLDVRLELDDETRQGLGDEAWQAALTCRQIAELEIRRFPLAGTHRLAGLPALKQLKRLTIEGGELTVEDAESIAGIEGLRELTLSLVSVTDESLRPLAKLKQLEKLWLVHQGRGRKATSAGLAFLQEMRALRSLQLARIESLDNDLLPTIAVLTNLESLDLGSAAIDGSQLSCLEHLPRLKSLNLIGTKVDDESMRHVARLTRLESLTVSFTEVTDAGVAHLESLQNLQVLHLSGPKITDRSAGSIAKLSRLEELGLRETQIGDAGLEAIAELPSLRTLWSGGNAEMSPVGIAKFKAASPNRSVH